MDDRTIAVIQRGSKNCFIPHSPVTLTNKLVSDESHVWCQADFTPNDFVLEHVGFKCSLPTLIPILPVETLLKLKELLSGYPCDRVKWMSEANLPWPLSDPHCLHMVRTKMPKHCFVQSPTVEPIAGASKVLVPTHRTPP